MFSKKTLGLSILFTASSLLSGCIIAESCPAVTNDETVDAFEVTLTTGGNGTDLDIEFCYELYSAAGAFCVPLDSPRDDFEPWHTDTFYIPVEPIRAGDLRSFEIYNAGGWTLLDGSWDLDALTVELHTRSGRWQLWYDADIYPDINLAAGEAFQPSSCDYY